MGFASAASAASALISNLEHRISNMELLVRLILLPPLLVAAFNGLMGLFAPGYRKQEWLIGGLATAAVALPFAVAVALFLGEGAGHGAEVVRYFTWLAAGDLQVDFAYRVDQLSLVMTLIVTGVGALIHLYSIGYMRGDAGYWRFFAYLNLFIFAMLNLVLAENLPVLFLGWEGVGLCSYLLIGFWYTNLKNSAAANKAFIVNRIGDFAFLLAMFILFAAVTERADGPFGLDFTTLLAPETLGALGGGTLLLVVLLFFVGATGKSAQIPLFVWLPDAMAGPTPVSALIHAATMVTSGLYLLARLSPMVLQAPGAMTVIAVVGALTAVMAATIAITQNDIKRVLAYSTVSQLGFMFLAAGVGAFFVSIFHVMTHAFFKGCLFLGSGSVIHGMHHVEHALQHKGLIPSPAGHDGHGGHGHDTPLDSEAHQDPLRDHPLPYDGPFDAQDLRTMGGLKKYMPVTRWTFLVATLAIAGLPPLAGFFSKDEILFKTFEFAHNDHGGFYFLWAVGLATALLTAVYMGRCYLLTFEGRPRWPDALDTHPHESPWTMTLPLVVLAFLSAVGGFLGLPEVLGESWIHHYLVEEGAGPVAEPTHELHVAHATEWGLLGLGALVAVAGLLLAWMRWGRRGLEADARLRRRLGALYGLFARKYYVDELYEGAVVRPVVEGARRVLAPFDLKAVDGAVNGLARLFRDAALGLRGIQTGVVQTYALYLVLGVVAVIALLLFA
jgi:NADH-quinone oxidoreductase subunit L